RRPERGQHLLHGTNVVDHENRSWHGGVTRDGRTWVGNQHSVVRVTRSRPRVLAARFSHLRNRALLISGKFFASASLSSHREAAPRLRLTFLDAGACSPPRRCVISLEERSTRTAGSPRLSGSPPNTRSV